MSLLLLALAAASPLPQQLSDGDAIVALAWERRSKEGYAAATSCVEVGKRTMAEQFRHPEQMLPNIVPQDDTNPNPDSVRLRRIFKGEGKTLDFDLKRLGLPAVSPGCKTHYWVSAPVLLDDHAYVEVGMTCPGLCGFGETLLLERRDGKWAVVKPIQQWVS